VVHDDGAAWNPEVTHHTRMIQGSILIVSLAISRGSSQHVLCRATEGLSNGASRQQCKSYDMIRAQGKGVDEKEPQH